jgi:hypothetical protein
MNAPERFNDVIETLLADRSPAVQVRCLNLKEQRMLLLAQRIRGNREQGPDPTFVQALRLRLLRRILPRALSIRN